ncbi:MAG TPA: hypothetical protein VIP77_24260 [Jiangellaceae bacterium]
MSFDSSHVGQARAAVAEGGREFADQIDKAQQAVGRLKPLLDGLQKLPGELSNAASALSQLGTNLTQTDVRPYQEGIAAARQSGEGLTQQAADLQATVQPVVMSLLAAIPQIQATLGVVLQQFSADVRKSDAALGDIQNS